MAKERFGPITAAVNCAGIGIAMKTLNKKGKAHPVEDFNKVLQVGYFERFIIQFYMEIIKIESKCRFVLQVYKVIN